MRIIDDKIIINEDTYAPELHLTVAIGIEAAQSAHAQNNESSNEEYDRLGSDFSKAVTEYLANKYKQTTTECGEDHE